MNKSIFLIITLVILVSCKRPVRQPIEGQKNPQVESEIPTESVIPSPVRSKKIPNNIPEDSCFLHGKIIRIVDGDTAELLYGELPVKLRLEHIDAPEKRGKQPYGNKAKKQLSNLCFGQDVCIISDGEFDGFGRLIGVIINDRGVNVNKEMVRSGYAWHFKKYSEDMSYDELERRARANRSGLWIDPNPIAPWDFR